MEKETVISAVVAHFKKEFAHESTGHDWYHIERVWKNAKTINIKEGGDTFIVELGALLHDIADHNDKNFSITSVWNDLIEKKKLYGFESSNKFYHLTDLETFKKLQDL